MILAKTMLPKCWRSQDASRKVQAGALTESVKEFLQVRSEDRDACCFLWATARTAGTDGFDNLVSLIR